MNTFSILFAFLWFIPLAVHFWGAWLVRRHFRDRPIPADTPFRLFPVSILKPLKGVDGGLEENLKSFFTLDYPEYEIFFSVANPRDPAIPVVRKLMKDFPETRAELVVGDLNVGLNPKINNLVRSYEQASYNWILISDSNVRVDARYLKNLVSQLDSDTGMLTSVVLGSAPNGEGARLEAMALNTFYAKAMVLAAWANQDCVLGKSMLFRKNAADRFGGLRALGNYLAEDYMAGEAMKHLGLKVTTAWHPVPQHIGESRISDFWKRHIRWGRIRKAQAPLAFLAELLSTSVVAGLFGAFTVPGITGIDTATFLSFHTITWFFLDLVVIRSLGAGIDLHTPIDWLVRELISPAIWIHAASGNTVDWRGARYQLGIGGVLTPVSVSS